MILTNDKLIAILKQQPSGTKILIENFDGSESRYLEETDIMPSWEREGDAGEEDKTENVMMFTVYREEPVEGVGAMKETEVQRWQKEIEELERDKMYVKNGVSVDAIEYQILIRKANIEEYGE